MKYLKRFNENIDHKFCGECGLKLDMNVAYCPECGTPAVNPDDVNSGKTFTIEIGPHGVIGVKDGGSLIIKSNKGDFYIDRKIGTKTPYIVTKSSKVKGNPSRRATVTEVDALIDALKTINKGGDLQDYIDGIIKTREDYSYLEMK